MYDFIVEGMKCGGCASRVTQAAKAFDAEAAVNVDLSTKTLHV